MYSIYMYSVVHTPLLSMVQISLCPHTAMSRKCLSGFSASSSAAAADKRRQIQHLTDYCILDSSYLDVIISSSESSRLGSALQITCTHIRT